MKDTHASTLLVLQSSSQSQWDSITGRCGRGVYKRGGVCDSDGVRIRVACEIRRARGCVRTVTWRERSRCGDSRRWFWTTCEAICVCYGDCIRVGFAVCVGCAGGGPGVGGYRGRGWSRHGGCGIVYLYAINLFNQMVTRSRITDGRGLQGDAAG